MTANYGVQYQLSLATAPAAVGSPARHQRRQRPAVGIDSGTDGRPDARLQPGRQRSRQRYDFRNWTGDVGSAAEPGNPVSVTMNQARSITANYRRPVPAAAWRPTPGQRSGTERTSAGGSDRQLDRQRHRR